MALQVLRLLSEIRMKARRTTTTAALNQMFEAHHDQMQDFVTWRESELNSSWLLYVCVWSEPAYLCYDSPCNPCISEINEAIFRNEGSHLKVPSHEVLNEGNYDIIQFIIQLMAMQITFYVDLSAINRTAFLW